MEKNKKEGLVWGRMRIVEDALVAISVGQEEKRWEKDSSLSHLYGILWLCLFVFISFLWINK